MVDFDLKKSTETVAESLADYFEQFILLLTKPRTAVQAYFDSTATSRKRIQRALIYAASSILLGICFARFVGLPKSPGEVNPQTAVAVLIIWILSAAALHPFLKLFRAKGMLQDTVIVFLLVISTLHLVFIPVLAIASRVLTDTKVTLSYDYVIYFGVGAKGNPYRSGGEFAEALSLPEDWRTVLEPAHTESFIKEKEPERDKTILPPASDLATYSTADVPLNPADRNRLSPSAMNFPRPERSEVPVVREGAGWLLLAFWLIYYLTNSAYLAAGLSVPHQRSPYFLFFLSIIGPLCIALFLAALVLFLRF